jgi:hypothetical protein
VIAAIWLYSKRFYAVGALDATEGSLSRLENSCILRRCALTSGKSVPAKPAWFSKLDYILDELRSSPRPFVDRATVEFLLGVGRRRAQQILAPCVRDRVGTNGLADRDLLIARLQQLARGEERYYEVQRRRRFAEVFRRLRKERIEQPQLPVEAPTHIVNQELENLPPGVHLQPGHIHVEFEEPQQALEKLLSLAMAIGNDFDRLERLTRHGKPRAAPAASRLGVDLSWSQH